MLGKAVAELRVVIFLTNTREYVYAFDLTDELEEGEPTRYLVEFFWLDVDSISKLIDKCYPL